MTTSVAEPAYCPTCELKHTRRPDWLCPRCGMPVETDAPARKTVRAPSVDERFPLGSRLAGATMVLGAGALAFLLARRPPVEHRWHLLGAIVVLAVLGVALLLKVSAARWVALALAIVAIVVASEGVLRERLPELIQDPLPDPIRRHLRGLLRALLPWNVLFVAGLDVGCLLLVVGRPRAVRIVAGVLLAAPLLALAVLRALGR